jgi:hypothetical protein
MLMGNVKKAKHVLSETEAGVLDYYKKVIHGMGSCKEIKADLLKNQMVLAEKDLDNSMFVELLKWAIKAISFWAEEIKIWFPQIFANNQIAIAC